MGGGTGGRGNDKAKSLVFLGYIKKKKKKGM
jgi:hypothetical protein